MKRISLIILFVITSASYSFIFKSDSGTGKTSIALQFITYNGFGNNLYIDNITAGREAERDIAITAFTNLPYDTLYSVGSSTIYIDSIAAAVTNVGRIGTARLIFKLEIPQLGYSDFDTIRAGLASKSIANVYFNTVSFAPGNTYDVILYLIDSAESNYSNDTLKRTFTYLQGVYRKPLFEEFTSTTSSSSAINNPSLNNFVNSKFDSIVAINYHLGFPAPGIDSMYLADTIQNNLRKDYYTIYSVPNLIFNGSYFSPFPYSTLNLQTSFDTLKKIGSPLSLNVTDTRLTGDTISTNITVTVSAPMKQGDYRLRVSAIERMKTYSAPPGTNGETIFYDIFRSAVNSAAGTSIQLSPGTYNFNYKYLRNSAWADSMIYTSAYIQNDNTLEVLNSNKSRAGVFDNLKNITIKSASKDYITKNAKELDSRFSHINKNSLTRINAIDSTDFYLEQFEGNTLPFGWEIENPSRIITFETIQGANGPTYPGSSALRMNFYSNLNIGQIDTLYSSPIEGLTSLDTLKFDYAYAGYLFGQYDSLTVNLSTDGGLSFNTTILHAGGQQLVTSINQSVSFVPTLPSQWRTFILPLQGIILDNYSSQIPLGYELKQNFPNPFNPITKIAFSIPVQTSASLTVYDIRGREVQKLLKNEILSPGSHEINFDGAILSSGVYFYVLATPDFVQSKKMVLIK